MNEDILKQQLQYLATMRGLSDAKLRAAYRKVFEKTIWYVEVNMDTPRDWIEARMFYAYCLAKPCYPKGSHELLTFKKRAREVLLEPPPEKRPWHDRYKHDLKKRVLFTRHNIKRMPDNEVDAYLALIGITLDATPKEKRRVLWEFYNLKAGELPVKIGARPKRINQLSLTDLIVRFPEMGWPEFQEAFKDVMPNTTKEQFYDARYRLKKRFGGVIPTLIPGRRQKNYRIKYDLSQRVAAKPVRLTDDDDI